MSDIESPTTFYLGREYDQAARRALPDKPIQYRARDLTTHAVVLGMTGSGKTGLCIDILEEAALDGTPALIIDPKGDIADLLLQFPELRAEDFAPWIDPDAAQRQSMEPEAFAAAEAQRWRAGLAEWGIGPERIRALRERVEFLLLTPGSDAGRPVSVLHTLRAPEQAEWDADAEGVRDKISGTVSALLGLIGVEADPVRSREHILLSNIFETAWRQGTDLDLTQLILQVNQPPFAKLGAFDIDTFYPEKDRFELATALNGLIAAPDFATWLEGEPLDVATLLRSPEGKPRVSLFYLAHLSDPERMFFITLLLQQVLGWLRTQPGTSNLRALLYFDEVYGYFPPYPTNPPSKSPLLRLLKEARAFGLGLLVVTQNPMDLDYKGLTNAGTWFIGKLQTDRDKARVLEGLEGVTASAQGFGRDEFDRLITALDKRVFILHNVNAAAPVVFTTRWAMSYLRGPMTRAELRRLAPAAVAQPAAQPAAAAAAPAAPSAVPVAAYAPGPAPEEGSKVAPALPSSIRQYYLPLTVAPEQALRRWAQEQGRTLPPQTQIDATVHYVPALLAQGLVRFLDRKSSVNREEPACRLVREIDPRGFLRWEDATVTALDPAVLGTAPMANATFEPVPSPLTNERKLAEMEKDFVSYLYRSMTLSLWFNPLLKVYSSPGQTEAEFQAACDAAARRARDDEAVKLQAKTRTRLETLRTRRATADRKRAALEAETQARQSERTLTNIESVFGVLTGRRVRRPLSAAQRAGRLAEQSQMDAQAAKASVAELDQQIAELEAQLERDLQALTDKWAEAARTTQPLQVTPKKTDIRTELFGIGWVPYWRVTVGADRLQLPAFALEG